MSSRSSWKFDWLSVRLPPHHTVFSVSASTTTCLSLGLRPVWTPVSAQKAPPCTSVPSPFLIACSTKTVSGKFQLTPARLLKPNLSAPCAPFLTPISATLSLRFGRLPRLPLVYWFAAWIGRFLSRFLVRFLARFFVRFLARFLAPLGPYRV